MNKKQQRQAAEEFAAGATEYFENEEFAQAMVRSTDAGADFPELLKTEKALFKAANDERRGIKR